LDNLIYEDQPPPYNSWVKVTPFIYLLLLVFIVLYLIVNGFPIEMLARGLILPVFIFPVIVAIYYWAATPRKYQIFENRIKIILGGPFSYSVPFDNIALAESGTWKDLWRFFGQFRDFVTCQSGEHLLKIVSVKGGVINITPGNRELFLDNLNKAREKWRTEKIAGQFSRKH
jgi:hypothetical protein